MIIDATLTKHCRIELEIGYSYNTPNSKKIPSPITAARGYIEEDG